MNPDSRPAVSFLRSVLHCFRLTLVASCLLSSLLSSFTRADYEPNDDVISANPIDLGVVVEGNLSSRDVDFYSFSTDEAADFFFEYRGEGYSSSGWYFELLDEELNRIAGGRCRFTDCEEGQTRSFSLLRGTYFIKISEWWSGYEAGAYSFSVGLAEDTGNLELEPNNSVNTSQPIMLGQSVSGHLHGIKDEDFYELSVTEASTFQLAIASEYSEQYGFGYELADESEAVFVAGSCKATCSEQKIVVFAVAPGVYKLKIFSYVPSDQEKFPLGGYSVTISRSEYSIEEVELEGNDEPDFAQSLLVDRSILGSSSSWSDSDYFKFETSADVAGTFFIDTTDKVDSSFDSYGWSITLFDESLDIIGFSEYKGGEQIFFDTGLTAGAYFLLVRPNGNNIPLNGSQYRLRLSISEQTTSIEFEHNDSSEAAQEISFYRQIKGRTTSYDEDFYSFSLEVPRKVSASIRKEYGGGWDWLMTILNEQGTEVVDRVHCNNCISDPAVIEAGLKPGNYVVRVWNYSPSENNLSPYYLLLEFGDRDGDGVLDEEDNCPLFPNLDQLDLDGDAVGDACDLDIDGDDVPNEDDLFPKNFLESRDLDGDGIGDQADLDDDNDGIDDAVDAFPDDPNESSDIDEDGVGDNSDQFPTDPKESSDLDSDGVGDNKDNCLAIPNAEQLDNDSDQMGDACDSDDDNDEVNDEIDFYPFDASRQKYCCQRALIVAGGGPYFGNALWPATKNMANFAYETLLFQGLDDDDIIYLSEEESDIVDGVPTNESVRQAVISLTESTDEKVGDVLIYMVDHGGDGVFKLDKQTLLYAEDLKVWLDELHQSYDGKSTVIYDACESGSFVPLLAANDGSQRMVITSSAAKQPAVFALNGYTSFSYFFWSSFYVGFNISDSQILAKQAMNLIWGQDPKFDANGDGLANTKSDKVSIEDFSFGQRAVKASDNPIVGDIQLEPELNGETEVAIKVVEVVGGTSVNKLLVFIDDPDSYIPLPDEPLLEANGTELSQNEDGSWSGILTGFTIAGNYEVSVVAENKGGLFSIPDESDTVTVTQLKGRPPVIELDTDLDGLGDLTDADDDNDGVEDTSDDFPLDANESRDSDKDGTGNNEDLDDDNDGFTDEEELADGTDPFSRFSCKSGCFSFDVDENLEAQPLTDGLLVIRHLFGFSGDALTSGAVASDANRDASEVIASYLTDADSQLDIDGDGSSKPLTDGLLLIRYLFGFSGDSLISGAIGSGAERDTADEVEAYIQERVPVQ